MASRWVEIAVPAVATLAGVLLTLAIQVINSRLQRKGDLRAAHAEVRRNAYVAFRKSAKEIRLLALRTHEIHAATEKIRTDSTEFIYEPLTARANAISEQIANKAKLTPDENRQLVAEIGLLKLDLAQSKERYIEHRNSSFERAKVGIPSVIEHGKRIDEVRNAFEEALVVIEFLGSMKVYESAAEFASLALSGLRVGEQADDQHGELYRKADSRFVKAVRDELQH